MYLAVVVVVDVQQAGVGEGVSSIRVSGAQGADGRVGGHVFGNIVRTQGQGRGGLIDTTRGKSRAAKWHIRRG